MDFLIWKACCPSVLMIIIVLSKCTWICRLLFWVATFTFFDRCLVMMFDMFVLINTKITWWWWLMNNKNKNWKYYFIHWIQLVILIGTCICIGQTLIERGHQCYFIITNENDIGNYSKFGFKELLLINNDDDRKTTEEQNVEPKTSSSSNHPNANNEKKLYIILLLRVFFILTFIIEKMTIFMIVIKK